MAEQGTLSLEKRSRRSAGIDDTRQCTRSISCIVENVVSTLHLKQCQTHKFPSIPRTSTSGSSSASKSVQQLAHVSTWYNVLEFRTFIRIDLFDRRGLWVRVVRILQRLWIGDDGPLINAQFAVPALFVLHFLVECVESRERTRYGR